MWAPRLSDAAVPRIPRASGVLRGQAALRIRDGLSRASPVASGSACHASVSLMRPSCMTLSATCLLIADLVGPLITSSLIRLSHAVT